MCSIALIASMELNLESQVGDELVNARDMWLNPMGDVSEHVALLEGQVRDGLNNTSASMVLYFTKGDAQLC